MLSTGLLSIQAQQRSNLRARYGDRAKLGATLISTLLAVEASPTQLALYSQEYGHKINLPQLARQRVQGQDAYLGVEDANGKVLASAGAIPAQVQKPPLSLAFEPIAIGNAYGNTVPLYLKFGNRILITGDKDSTLQEILNPLLEQLQPDTGSATIIDRSYYIVAGVNLSKVQYKGQYVHIGGYVLPPYRASLSHPGTVGKTGKYFVSANIGPNWRVFVSEYPSVLYRNINGLAFWFPWMALGLTSIAISVNIWLTLLTERRKEALEKQTVQLAELNSAVEKEKIKLVFLNQDLQSFAGAAAHDIRAPLRRISSFAELIKDDGDNKLTFLSKNYLERMIRNANELDTLCTDLVSYARAGENLKLERVNPKRCGDKVRELLADEMSKKGVKASSTVPEGIFVKANAAALTQVFLNLIQNAIKFSDGPPKIDISMHRQSNDMYAFDVRDYGIGIDPQYRERVFEPFKRLHTTQEYPGTGIGLSMVKRLVEKMDGTVTILDPPDGGKGTVFRVSLKRDA